MSGYKMDRTYSGWTQDVWWLVEQARQQGAGSVNVRHVDRDGQVLEVSADWPATTGH